MWCSRLHHVRWLSTLRPTAETMAYKSLGLQWGAPQSQVKEAYLRLAKQFHPDVRGVDGQERFLEIRRAYELLQRRRNVHREPAAAPAHQPPKPRPYRDVFLTFTEEEALMGCVKEVVVQKEERCEHCRGLGCNECRRRGHVLARHVLAVSVPAGVKSSSVLAHEDGLRVHIRVLPSFMEGTRRRVKTRRNASDTLGTLFNSICRFVRRHARSSQ